MGLRAARLKRIKHRYCVMRSRRTSTRFEAPPPSPSAGAAGILAVWSRRGRARHTSADDSRLVVRHLETGDSRIGQRRDADVRRVSGFALPVEPIERALRRRFPRRRQSIRRLSSRGPSRRGRRGPRRQRSRNVGPFQLYENRRDPRHRPPPRGTPRTRRFSKSSSRVTATAAFPSRSARASRMRSRSDIFVSIHVNSMRNPNSRGVETYYSGRQRTVLREARRSRESVVRLLAGPTIARCSTASTRTRGKEESRALAESVQRELYQDLGPLAEGSRTGASGAAPFIVLVAHRHAGDSCRGVMSLESAGCGDASNQAYRQKIASRFIAESGRTRPRMNRPQRRGFDTLWRRNRDPCTSH